MGQKLCKCPALKGWFTLKNVFGVNFFIITLHNIRNVNSVSYSQYHRTTEVLLQMHVKACALTNR